MAKDLIILLLGFYGLGKQRLKQLVQALPKLLPWRNGESYLWLRKQVHPDRNCEKRWLLCL